MTELDLSGDEMSEDGDINANGSDSERPRETMRSGRLNTVTSHCELVQVTSFLFNLRRGNTVQDCRPVALTGTCRSSTASASISPCFSTYIPLMRLAQTVHHTKKRGGSILREGWLLHHTNIDSLVKHAPLIPLNRCKSCIACVRSGNYLKHRTTCIVRENVITGSWTGKASPCSRMRAAPNTTRLQRRLM